MKKTYYSKLFCAIVVVGLFMVFNNMSFAEEPKVYTDADLRKYNNSSDKETINQRKGDIDAEIKKILTDVEKLQRELAEKKQDKQSEKVILENALKEALSKLKSMRDEQVAIHKATQEKIRQLEEQRVEIIKSSEEEIKRIRERGEEKKREIRLKHQ